jgi:hypothetical protein
MTLSSAFSTSSRSGLTAWRVPAGPGLTKRADRRSTRRRRASTTFLDFYGRVGPLSGKTLLAAAVYFGALLVFWLIWRGRDLRLKPVLVAAVILLLLGLLGTFPTFFQAVAE